MKLTFEKHDYPNPKYKWCVVKLDGLEIGRCEMDAGGWECGTGYGWTGHGRTPHEAWVNWANWVLRPVVRPVSA